LHGDLAITKCNKNKREVDKPKMDRQDIRNSSAGHIHGKKICRQRDEETSVIDKRAMLTLTMTGESPTISWWKATV
jgi:hypothetical protein